MPKIRKPRPSAPSLQEKSLFRAKYPVHFFDDPDDPRNHDGTSRDKPAKLGRPIFTLMDALTRLDEMKLDIAGQPIGIKALPLRLPTNQTTTLLMLFGKVNKKPDLWYVPLPTSASFMATTTRDCRQRYDATKLNNARTDLDGNVRLWDGTELHQVEFSATKIVGTLTQRQLEILALAIKCSDGVDAVRRADPAYPHYAIDFAQLRDITWASLATIERFIPKYTRHASREEITRALTISGARVARE